MLLLKGQRVQTVLGPGTILGFEVIKYNGWPGPVNEIDPQNGCRVLVKLDDPTSWIATVMTPNPYIYQSQLSELKE